MREMHFNILKLINTLHIKVDKYSSNDLFIKKIFINNIVKIIKNLFIKKNLLSRRQLIILTMSILIMIFKNKITSTQKYFSFLK